MLDGLCTHRKFCKLNPNKTSVNNAFKRKETGWICEFCKEKFTTRAKLYEHLKTCAEKLKLPHDSRGRLIRVEKFAKRLKTLSLLRKEGKFVSWNKR